MTIILKYINSQNSAALRFEGTEFANTQEFVAWCESDGNNTITHLTEAQLLWRYGVDDVINLPESYQDYLKSLEKLHQTKSSEVAELLTPNGVEFRNRMTLPEMVEWHLHRLSEMHGGYAKLINKVG
jgi:hypothetical protein